MKPKLFGKKLEQIAHENKPERHTHVNHEGAVFKLPEDLSEKIRKLLEEDSPKRYGWKEEIRQAAQRLGLADNLPYGEIFRKYLPLQGWYTQRTFEREILRYIESNQDALNLHLSSHGRIYRKDLIDKIKQAGDELISAKGTATNREITLRLGLKPTTAIAASIRGVTETCYINFGWNKETGAQGVEFIK
jgi:hypothetical protein